MRGTIVKWFADREYGFIKPHAMPHDVVLYAAHVSSDREPYIGATVEFDTEPDREEPRRHPVAVNVRVLS